MKFLLFLFFPFFSFAQKIESDKVDEFEGYRVVATSVEQIRGKNILSKQYLAFNATKYMDKKDTTMTIAFMTLAPYTLSIDKGADIMLKLHSGQIMKLKHAGSYHIYAEGDFFTAYAQLTDEQMDTLITDKVEKIRVSASSVNVDVDIDEKKTDIIPNSVKLLKEYKL